jgi:hypothetical protein
MPEAENVPFIDTSLVIGSADALRRTFGAAEWSVPAVPDVHNGPATQSIGDALAAVHGLAGLIAAQMETAAMTMTTAALETEAVDVPLHQGDDVDGWVEWPD